MAQQNYAKGFAGNGSARTVNTAKVKTQAKTNMPAKNTTPKSSGGVKLGTHKHSLTSNGFEQHPGL